MLGRFTIGAAILLAFVIILYACGIMIAYHSDALLKFVYIVPIIFLFLAITAFLLILLHYAVVLQRNIPGLAVGALGLPEGSVRAFLAIGLLVLVAVFGTFLYFESKAGFPQAGIITAASLEEAKNAIDTTRFMLIPSGNDTYAVVSTSPDTSRSDLAKQLLTMIATLLTTIVGFYFGSATGSAGAGGGAGAATVAAVQQSATTARGAAAAQSQRIAALGPEVAKLATPEPQGAVNKALEQLRTKIGEAEKSIKTAEDSATRAGATAREIEAARDQIAEAAKSVDAIKTKLDGAAGDKLATLKPD